MRQVPIQDVIALAVPEQVDCHNAAILAVLPMVLERMARDTVWAQYDDRPKKPALRNFTYDWLITDKPEEIETFQPAHDCPRCHGGNAKAWAFLQAHPGRFVALGNIFYTEVW